MECSAIPKSVGTGQILDAEGRDIYPVLSSACAANGIAIELALACCIAESSLFVKAERWGTQDVNYVRSLIDSGDTATLQSVINACQYDISFGYGQRIVTSSYVGDHSMSVQNVLSVRDYVFSHPDEDLQQMCSYLAGCQQQVVGADLSPVNGDAELMSLVVYNAGSVPDNSYWQNYSANVARYQDALVQAKKLLE